jgi:uncharacterized Zn ribbon protein
MFSHQCISPECSKTYQSKDEDPYYCETCTRKRNAIAKVVDKKMASIPRKPQKSALQQYDESPKVNGFLHVRL